MEGVVGDAGKGDKPAPDDGKVAFWSPKVTTDYFVFTPHPSDDFRGEDICAK